VEEKIRLEDIKEFKIERKVFDERTLFAIYKVVTKGFVKSVESLVKEGKESLIVSAKDKNENWLALKIYRTSYCDFKSMWKYLIADPRFKGIKKARRSVVYNWCRREFSNLKTAFDFGINCPEPIAFYENVLVMKFIGENGIPAPRLVDLKLEKGEAEVIYKLIFEEMKKLLKAKLVHTDLSPYNILIWEKPYLIDFSQAVTFEHPFAKEFFERDVKNINNFFEKFGVKVKKLTIK
jgi:RIO kinase 1